MSFSQSFYQCEIKFEFIVSEYVNELKYSLLSLQELGNLSSLELIDNDGSPSARKLFLLWNPVMVLFVGLST